jgi:CheY-like chemotaxis protein
MKRTNLLIENNMQNRNLAMYLLEKRGFPVLPANDGPTGIELVVQLRPYRVLPGFQLPRMDTCAVALKLQRNATLEGVAVTSYVMAGDREEVLTVSHDCCPEKPFSTETFAADLQCHSCPQSEGSKRCPGS